MNCFLREKIKIILYLVIYCYVKDGYPDITWIINEGNKGINNFIWVAKYFNCPQILKVQYDLVQWLIY